MTVSIFLMLLTGFSVITALITEAVKKFFDGTKIKYASNIIALVVAFLVGIGGCAIFYIYSSVPFTLINVFTMVLMGLSNWLGATLGYDKVTQAITQLTK